MVVLGSFQPEDVVTIPAIAFAEWWRGLHRQQWIRDMFTIEPMDEELGAAPSLAMIDVPTAHINDAIVMASAARRGDVVYTSDVEDLTRLRDQHFRSVLRILGV